MTVGERIKARRKQIGMSAERVAAELQVSPSTIYRYENGDIEKMGIDKLEPIASAIHTTPAYLMGWTNDWYDYDLDEDGRLCQIPLAQFKALQESYPNDLEAVWHAWEKIQEDSYNEWGASVQKETRKKEELIESGFFRVMQRAKDSGYTPEDVQMALDFLERARKRDQS